MSENRQNQEFCMRILAKGRRVSDKGRRRPGARWEYDDSLTLQPKFTMPELLAFVKAMQAAGIVHDLSYSCGAQTVKMYPNAENYKHPRTEYVKRFGARPEWLLFLLPDEDTAAAFFKAVAKVNGTEIQITPGRRVSEDAPQWVLTVGPVGR